MLLTCVGLNDPFNQYDDRGPVLSLCHYLKTIDIHRQKYLPIAAIYLLSTIEKPGSVQPTQRRGEQTRDILEAEGWRVYTRPLNLLDPTDYTELVPAMSQTLQGIIQEWGNQGEYLVNTSPGTSQMEAVWISLYNTGLLPRATLLQVKAPWTEPDEEKRVRPVNIAPLVTVTPTRGIYCNLETGQVWVDGKEITGKLSEMQRKLIQLIWQKNGAVCTYREIEDGVYGWAEGGGRAAIRELANRTRKHVEADPKKPRYLLLVKGEGYRLGGT